MEAGAREGGIDTIEGFRQAGVVIVRCGKPGIWEGRNTARVFLLVLLGFVDRGRFVCFENLQCRSEDWGAQMEDCTGGSCLSSCDSEFLDANTQHHHHHHH